MDKMVQDVQQWLNDTWPKKFKYDETGVTSGEFPVKPDGMTGNTTVKALVMALQLHFNLGADGIWGGATDSACPVISINTSDEILLRIVQGGFICKGYNAGGFDGVFGPALQSAINQYKTDLGIPENNKMEPDVFKSLLTTDPTVKVSGGSDAVRAVQQYLNRNYYSVFKKSLGYLPTGGINDRKTSKALIFAFQDAIGTAADGSIGNNTYRAMPSIGKGVSNSRLVSILQCALTCNGYEVSVNGNYSDKVVTAVTNFQKFMCLNLDSMVTMGSVNRRTWSALLHSKGDPERDANACDCATILDAPKAALLVEHGYKIVGRYLTGTVTTNGVRVSKALTIEEIQIASDAGLKIFPIYQDGGAASTYFKYDQGYSDAKKAVIAAKALRIPYGEIIYFAVDYDFNEIQCRDQIIPHFEGIAKYMAETGADYRVGIYGSRNICTTVSNKNLACSSFVADMSTGYSGNLGFKMPANWAFDQFHEYGILGSNLQFPLDKDMASGRYEGFNANTKCGHDKYKDCTKHKMRAVYELGQHNSKKLLYYKCPICGYKVKAPYQQDKEILTDKEYMCIQAGYLLLTYFSDLTKKGIWYSNVNVIKSLTLGMQLIRLPYQNRYEYCDGDGRCLEETLIVPETSGMPYIPQSGNILDIKQAIVDGLFAEFAAGIGEILACFAFPELAPFFALEEVSEVIMHPNKFSEDGISFIFKQIAGTAEMEALNVILDLLTIGIDLEDDGNINSKINMGDYIVEFTACTYPGIKACKVVFDKNSLKVKGIACDYYNA